MISLKHYWLKVSEIAGPSKLESEKTDSNIFEATVFLEGDERGGEADLMGGIRMSVNCENQIIIIVIKLACFLF